MFPPRSFPMSRPIFAWKLAVAVLLMGSTAIRADEPFAGIKGDKTLVVWAAPVNLMQRGGSALTIDDGRTHFDGVVFGELAPARWMAGSDFHRRTLHSQDAVPKETADAKTLVQIAISYRGNE